ncbi:MAG: hypothetical protein A3B47_02495 [Candidatus Levybacteria bacterium RIFCSPLOWO2_01_FULL_39_24]|nr:MAG: hypothetical protein A2800_01790 [Candidatus Levybacteria bacterium RIFCSPHIGHO2_01_FULL_40_16]OGH28269.1 MAG: hypothetical protein A3E12_02060 [Candidatus Levybacteria bacterium RIFCSPHIGHO2_12_FULL_39_9]OGH46499.1 MAG: hypothetical protein A3B47_02495 [Candidatus Levybacteria bacterium RIFCSPLOWO2_01_FULL_39_24]
MTKEQVARLSSVVENRKPLADERRRLTADFTDLLKDYIPVKLTSMNPGIESDTTNATPVKSAGDLLEKIKKINEKVTPTLVFSRRRKK